MFLASPDMDRTVSDVLNPARHRFNGRTAQPLGQTGFGCGDRHRGAKPPRRVNSWGDQLLSLSNFYPLSTGFPQNRRILKTFSSH